MNTNFVPPELQFTVDQVRRRHVLHVLELCHGNRTQAAQMLGIDRKTLFRNLKKWNIHDVDIGRDDHGIDDRSERQRAASR